MFLLCFSNRRRHPACWRLMSFLNLKRGSSVATMVSALLPCWESLLVPRLMENTV